MKAAVIHETGGPEVLQLEEVDTPEPGDGEVLVKVGATSINPLEAKQRAGVAEISLPAILGYDIAGVVESSRSDRFSQGERVFGRASAGSYAEYAVAGESSLAVTPDGVSDEQAATIPVAGATAWQGLFDKAGLDGGQTALIAGAAGGVGHFAVQFAKGVEARVIATGSSRNRDFVLGLGADEFVDYTEQEPGQAVSDANVIFDAVGGNTTEGLVPALAEGGILVTIAASPPEQAAAERGARALVFSSGAEPDQLAEIAELVAVGGVRPEISEALPLDEIQRAHELSDSGHTRGKIVIRVGS